MLGYFPKYYTDKAMLIYCALLICVPVIFGYPMEWYFWIFGIVEVISFFYFANKLPQRWAHYSPKVFTKELFKTAVTVRVIYVVFSYWFYDLMTGQPFEFGAADVLFYHEIAMNSHYMLDNGGVDLVQYYLDRGMDLSDSGYPLYLSIVYYTFGDSILIARIIKVFWSAYTCILIYKLATRNFGEEVGRMASVFCLLMPNLIYYCGSHLKETEMVFLIVLFIERVDFAIRGNTINWKALIFSLLVCGVLFMFRTALAIVAILSLVITLMLSSNNFLSIAKKITIGTFVAIVMIATLGNKLVQEAQGMIEKGENAQERSMEWRSNREGGNKFAKYAGASVFAPLIFTIPFPTMVNTPTQEQQRMIHGGNYVKNITSAFTIMALFILLMNRTWRRHVLIIGVTCGYLIVMALSEFAHSERFHLPALPFALIFAAYGISSLQNKHKKWFNYWVMFIFVVNIAWAWFKLRGRGM